jgi:hypothetical protein
MQLHTLLHHTLDEDDCSVRHPGIFTTGTEPTEREEAGGLQRQSGRPGEEKCLLPLA